MKNNEFLNKFQLKLDNGDYDQYLTLPFMKKEFLIANVKFAVAKKVEKEEGTGLSDIEIATIIKDIKETAGRVFYLMVKYKILEQKEDGSFGLTKKGAVAIGEVGRQRISRNV